MSGEAAISVILPTDDFELIRETVRSLAAQTIVGSVELVMVAPPGAGAFDADACAPLAGVRAVELAFESLPAARAAGVRAATAPIVLFGETHCFPDPHTLEALVERHREPWGAVAQTICIGNPRSLISWSNHYIDYGPWVEGQPGGERDRIPHHNTSYKRELLLPYGDRLAGLIEFDEALYSDLRARGFGLYLDPRATTRHLNVSLRSSWLDERFVAGRSYASRRSGAWPRSRRLFYAAASPLIPAVRLVRIVGDIRRTGHAELLPKLLATLVTGLVVSAVGECAGYAAGAGDSGPRLHRYELARAPHLRAGEFGVEAAGAHRV